MGRWTPSRPRRATTSARRRGSCVTIIDATGPGKESLRARKKLRERALWRRAAIVDLARSPRRRGPSRHSAAGYQEAFGEVAHGCRCPGPYHRSKPVAPRDEGRAA